MRRYQTRINHLFERYQSQDIGFYYVSSNSNEDFVDVKDEYAKRSLAIPLLRDERGEFKNAIGVKGTPSAAVIDSRGEMIFLGWIDNERGENETGRASYLENAIRDVLQNENVKVPTSPMFGCPIR